MVAGTRTKAKYLAYGLHYFPALLRQHGQAFSLAGRHRGVEFGRWLSIRIGCVHGFLSWAGPVGGCISAFLSGNPGIVYHFAEIEACFSDVLFVHGVRENTGRFWSGMEIVPNTSPTPVLPYQSEEREIVRVMCGSRLYGTDHSDSDYDFRSVHVPTVKSLILGTGRQHWKGTEGDLASFSVQKFVAMAMEGQPSAIEMLHAPQWALSSVTPDWTLFRDLRRQFHSKRMISFVAFARTMANRYGARALRLKVAEDLVALLSTITYSAQPDQRLAGVWELLPDNIYSKKTRDSDGFPKMWEAFGRQLPATSKVGYALDVVSAIRNGFGKRVEQAAKGGVDWKSMAHAFRVAYQLREILDTGDLKFPLDSAPFLREVLTRTQDVEALAVELEELANGLTADMERSALPPKPDRNLEQMLILSVYGNV